MSGDRPPPQFLDLLCFPLPYSRLAILFTGKLVVITFTSDKFLEPTAIGRCGLEGIKSRWKWGNPEGCHPHHLLDFFPWPQYGGSKNTQPSRSKMEGSI